MGWLSVSNLQKEENGLRVIDHLSFQMDHGERLAIMGETGSGKSSLLKMVAGLMQPDGGQILFEEQKVEGPLERLIPGQPGIGYLSQYFELRPNFFVHEVLEYANELATEEAQEIYSLCEIDHLLNRKTTQLSGGEKQRIALARLLTLRPRLLLLDEPFSHLDIPHRKTIKNVIERTSSNLRFSCLLVSHEPADVLPWATRILFLRNGKIVDEGTPQEISRFRKSPYPSGILGLD